MKGTPEEKAAWQREYRRNNQEHVRAQDARHKFRKKHGIDIPLDVVKELKKQQFCSICGCEELGSKGLAIDHCHKTKKIRGMLCQNCNQALGKFKDNVLTMQKAIQYLIDNQ